LRTKSPRYRNPIRFFISQPPASAPTPNRFVALLSRAGLDWFSLALLGVVALACWQHGLGSAASPVPCNLITTVGVALVFVLIWGLGRLPNFSRADNIADVFYGSKKPLVQNSVMASLLFPAGATGLILLPLMRSTTRCKLFWSAAWRSTSGGIPSEPTAGGTHALILAGAGLLGHRSARIGTFPAFFSQKEEKAAKNS
jgi:hypothetical protein